MSVLNLTTLRTELRRNIRDAAVSNAQLNRWCNLAQDDVNAQVDPEYLIASTTISTVAARRVYYVPDAEYNKIISVVDETNGHVLEQRTEFDMESFDPELDDQGTGFYYASYGYSEVQGTPSAAATARIVSTSASDTTQRVRIHGIVSAVERTELLTLNGTTNVTGTLSYTSIFGVRKDVTTTGVVTVSVTDAGTTTIAVLSPNALVRFYQPIYIQYVPNAVNTLRVRYYRKTRQMVFDEDIPDVSSDAYHELVLVGAKIRGYRDLHNFEQAKNVLVEEYLPLLNTFKKQQGNKRGRKSPVIGETDQMFVEIGRLPPQYGWPEW